jgi:predicted RNA-binding Zn-ribbon protein involved in translation (DUF1610 family)
MTSVQIAIADIPLKHKCPQCSGRDRVVRSHLRWWHPMLAVFGLKSYRCLACGMRFTAR